MMRFAVVARDCLKTWRTLGANDAVPCRVESVELTATLLGQLEQSLIELSEQIHLDLNQGGTFRDIETRLRELYQARAIFLRFPELHRLENEVRGASMGPLLDQVVARGFAGDQVVDAVDYAWLASVLEHLEVELPALASFDDDAHDAAVRDFVAADEAHIQIASKRVLRAWAEKAVATRDAYSLEAAQVERQASLKRRHMPIRELFDQSEHVLTAVKPCWVMSPLVVAQILPSRPCFDVVVFDEASQIPPADAACSLLRGERAVVAGDPHQLPPTSFFVSGIEDEEEEVAEDESVEPNEEQSALIAARNLALTQGQESILDVLKALLPVPYGTRVLNWHYRSLDERLITFSNAQETLYDWSLTTFPGDLPDAAISHELVPFRQGIGSVNASNSDEVTRVVELIADHLVKRPEESLGVIALGIKHAPVSKKRSAWRRQGIRRLRPHSKRLSRSSCSSRTSSGYRAMSETPSSCRLDIRRPTTAGCATTLDRSTRSVGSAA